MGIWDLKGKEDNSQKDGESKWLLNKCLSCWAETMEHREESEQTGLPSPPAVFHREPIFSVVLPGNSSLPGPGPPSKVLEAVKGDVKSSSRVFWGLIIFSLK